MVNKILTAISFVLLVVVLAGFTYTEFVRQETVVAIELNSGSSETIREMATGLDQIVMIKEMGGNRYSVIFKTGKTKEKLLESLFENEKVRKATVLE